MLLRVACVDGRNRHSIATMRTNVEPGRGQDGFGLDEEERGRTITELDHIQSRFREQGMSARDIVLSQAIQADLARRSGEEAELDRVYWHTVAFRRKVGVAMFGVDD